MGPQKRVPMGNQGIYTEVLSSFNSRNGKKRENLKHCFFNSSVMVGQNLNKMGVCCHFVEQITSFLLGTLQFEKTMSSRGNTLLHFRKQNLYLKIKTTSNKTLRKVPPIWHTNQTFSRLASSPGNLILWNICGISEKVFMACIYSLKGLQGAKDIRVIQ